MKIKKFYCFFIIVLLIISSNTSLAHSGRTDSSGGHHDYQNKSGLGNYHYHHGYGPHLHNGGVCPYGGGYEENYESPSPSITLKRYPKTLKVGQSSDIDFSINDSTDNYAYIESSNPDVIYIDDDGKLIAQKEGTAKITISTFGTSSEFTIKVKPTPVKNVKIKNKIKELQLGKSYRLKSKVSPKKATYKKLNWKSSNDKIISVNDNGVITANSVGNATISCTSKNKIKDKLTIKVFEVFPEEIITNYQEMKLDVNQIEALDIKLSPENINNTNCQISIDNANVAQIVGYTSVIGLKEGNTKLTITTINNIKKEIPIKVVYRPVEKISIDDSNIKYLSIPFLTHFVSKNEKIELTAFALPENASMKDISWESSNSDVIKIEKDNFIIQGTGKVTLTAYGYDNVNSSITFHIVNQTMVLIFVFIIVFLCIFGVMVVLLKKYYKIKNDK